MLCQWYPLWVADLNPSTSELIQNPVHLTYMYLAAIDGWLLLTYTFSLRSFVRLSCHPQFVTLSWQLTKNSVFRSMSTWSRSSVNRVLLWCSCGPRPCLCNQHCCAVLDGLPLGLIGRLYRVLWYAARLIGHIPTCNYATVSAYMLWITSDVLHWLPASLLD